MEPTPVQVQQSVTVRIKCDGKTGSGILALPGDGGLLYILTAKHVLFGDKYDTPPVKTTIIIDHILSVKGKPESYQLTGADDIIAFDNNDNDLAIVIIKTPGGPFDRELAAKSKYIDDDYGLKRCSLRGFPAMNDNKENRSISCEFEEFRAGKPGHFLVHCIQLLDTMFDDASNNVAGLSGGGAFFEFEEKTLLLGIIMKYTDVNSFYAIRTGMINELLKKHEYQELTLSAPVVEEKIRLTIAVLKKNSLILQGKISNTIGEVHISRPQTSKAAELLRNNRLLILWGAPGAGKSAFAKETAAAVQQSGAELMVFNGEQFTYDTLNEVLSGVGIPLTIDELISNTAFRNKKIFWIESVEKLLETDRTGAFEALLKLAKNNESIKIIVTTRTYMLQQLQLIFRWSIPTETTALEVRIFDDDEMTVVAKHFPGLQQLLDNPKINRLLKVPFYLNKAVSILPMEPDENLSEAGLTASIWKKVIEKDIEGRGKGFEDLCVRRARQMSLFATSELPGEVLRGLTADGLIVVEDDGLNERFSPSHDVLEDWALMRFIKRNMRDHQQAAAFFKANGNGPAMRRAFRLWMAEALLDYNRELAEFISEAIASTELDKYWKDELYVAVLLSAHSAGFFAQNEALMLEHSGILTYKFVTLLKMACRDYVPDSANSARAVLRGSGWGAMVSFLYKHREHFTRDAGFVLSFLLQWKALAYTRNSDSYVP